MTSWRDQFSPIDTCVIVSEGANTLTTDKYAQKSIPCGCEPSYPGEPICRDHRCINFSTQTECVRCKAECNNKKFQNKQYAKLAVIETPGKGHGLFAAENLKKKQFLMEYVGEIIDDDEFTKRSAARGRILEHQYIMQLKSNVLLDAGRKGSISRFINHSCEPNCCVEIWTVQGNLRVGIFTICDIPEGTELTFDYKWTRSARPPTRCNCGTEYCRGYLEILTEADKAELKLQRGVWRKGGAPIEQPAPVPVSVQVTSTSATHETTETLIGAPIQVPVVTVVTSGANMATFDDGAPMDIPTPTDAPGPVESTAPDGSSSVTPQSAPSPALNDIYNAQGLLVPELLIGRRVKVWWAGNLAYLEADVESYNQKNNHYLCRYLVDDSVSEEDFGPSVGSAPSPTTVPTTATATTLTGASTSFSGVPGGGDNKSSTGIGGVVVKWYWRDTSVEETVIKKKASAEVLGDDDASHVSAHSSDQPSPRANGTNAYTASNASSALYAGSFGAANSYSNTYSNGYTNSNGQGNGTNGNGGGVNPFTQNTSARVSVLVTAAAARIVTQQFAPGSDEDENGCKYTSTSHKDDWQNVLSICQHNFRVKATLLNEDEPNSGNNNSTYNNGAGTGTYNSSKRVVVYGTHEDVAEVSKLFKEAEKQHLSKHSTQQVNQMKALRNRQGVVCTNDWRFRTPATTTTTTTTTNTTNNATNKANLSHFEAYFTQKLTSMPDLACISVLNPTDLPVGVNANGSAEIAENVRKTLLLNMQGLCVKLGFTASATTQAVSVLTRYFRYVTGNVVKESTSLIAGVALLAAKQNPDFRYKAVSSIVRSAYCQVFRREVTDVTLASMEPYLESALDKERVIYGRLACDVFSADVVPLFASRVRQTMWADKWSFDHEDTINPFSTNLTTTTTTSTTAASATNGTPKDKHKDREAERLRRKKVATFQYETNLRYGVRRSVLHVGETLAQELLNIYSAGSGVGESSGNMVLSVLPVELVQLSCIVVVAILHTMVPSVAAHKRIVNEVDTCAAEVVAMALGPLQYSAALLRWSTEVFAEACLDQFPHLVGLFDCFRELRDTKADVVSMLRRSVGGCLMNIVNAVSAGSVTTSISTSITTSSTSTGGRGSNGNSNAGDAYGLVPPPPAAPLPPANDPLQPFQDSDEPCKHRFPWLNSGSSSAVESGAANGAGSSDVCLHSSLSVDAFRDGKYCPPPVKDSGYNGYGGSNRDSNTSEDLLVPCAKDTYFGFASLSTDAAKFLPRVACVDLSTVGSGGSASIKNSTSTSAGLLSVRPFPAHKTLLKEAKRAGFEDVSQLGPLPATLSELLCMQHLHYFYNCGGSGRGSGSEGMSGECPYIIAPVGVVTVSAATLNANAALRTTLSETVSLKHKENTSLAAQLAHDAQVKHDLHFLAFPAVHLSLATVLGFNTPRTSPRWDLTSRALGAEHRVALGVLENNNGHLFAPAFAVELCRDLYRAVEHMTACGVHLKWLVLDHLYITSGGRLQVGGLTGAVMSNSNGTDDTEDPPSVPHLSAQLTLQKNGLAPATSSSTTPSKKKKFALGTTFEDEEEDENTNKYDAQCRRAVARMAVPRAVLYTVAPEVLLGGGASGESSLYSAGAVAVQILTGKPLIKNAAAEDKQLQYVYKTLGTPKPMDYADFDALPLAQYYGRHIVDEEDNKLRESRSRANKALKELCPGPLLAGYSYGNTGAGDDRHLNLTVGGIRLADAVKVCATPETDSTGVLDLIRVSMSLVPHRRLSAELLLCFRVFREGCEVRRALAAAPSGHQSRQDFAPLPLHLTTGTTLSNVALTEKSRLSHMEELVSILRAIQGVPLSPEVVKKDVHCTPLSAAQVRKLSAMDAILFRKERARQVGGNINGGRDGEIRGARDRGRDNGRDGYRDRSRGRDSRERGRSRDSRDRGSDRGGDRGGDRSSDRGRAPPLPVVPPAPVPVPAPVYNNYAYPAYNASAQPVAYASGYSAFVPAAAYPAFPTYTTAPPPPAPAPLPRLPVQAPLPPTPAAPAPLAPAVPPPPSLPSFAAPTSVAAPVPPPARPTLLAAPTPVPAPAPPAPPSPRAETEPDYDPFDESEYEASNVNIDEAAADFDSAMEALSGGGNGAYGADSGTSTSASKRPASPPQQPSSPGGAKKPRTSH